MGEYCFSLHPSVSACLVGPHVAGVPSYFLWNLWVKVKKTTEKAITRSKDTEKAVEYRILIIEEQYSSYLLPISIKWWPFRSYSVAFSNNLKPQKAFSSSSSFTSFLLSPSSLLSSFLLLYSLPLSSSTFFILFSFSPFSSSSSSCPSSPFFFSLSLSI